MSGARSSIVSERGARGDERRELRARPGAAVHGRLRRAAARRHRRRRAPPTAFARPVASSSRFGRSGGSSGLAKARAAAIVSVKLMSAMPSAAGQSRATSGRSGIVEGRQAARDRADGLDAQSLQTEAGPSPRFRRRRRRAAPAARGKKSLQADQEHDRGDADRRASEATSRGMWRTIAARLRKKPVLGKWMPRASGSGRAR